MAAKLPLQSVIPTKGDFMKKLIVFTAFAILLKATGLLPFTGSDAAQLLPVRALTVDLSEGEILLDGGEASGRGKTLDEALSDLQATAVGTVFLATAQQVILSPRALSLLPELCRWDALRPAARVLLASGDLPKPEDAADYLESHDSTLTLQQVRAGYLRGETAVLPLLHSEEGGLRLEHRQNG